MAPPPTRRPARGFPVLAAEGCYLGTTLRPGSPAESHVVRSAGRLAGGIEGISADVIAILLPNLVEELLLFAVNGTEAAVFVLDTCFG